MASWPLHGDDAANRVRLAFLLAACTRLLRPGGCLVLAVGVPVGVTAGPQDFTPLVTAAATAGLGYLQHIVAVTADTDVDTFVYHVTDEELLTLARTDVTQWTVRHLRVHTDLLVFSHPTSAGSSTRPKRPRPEPQGRSARQATAVAAGPAGGRRG